MENFVEAIARKRDGLELTRAEIDGFVGGAVSGTVPDEQLAAMLMAICIRSMTAAETSLLVDSMLQWGERWQIGVQFPDAVDKHSTGGVGDSVSLVFAPLVRSCGIPVVMMAGAGLGHTQGTLDKLAAIPGFATAGNREEAVARLSSCGVVFARQSGELSPADKKLYLLRDTTGTVPSLPLITASIMSKKLAVGAARLVLDVKQGAGAFCKTAAMARELARGLHGVGEHAGVEVRTLISDMEEPLGARLGTASEVLASLDVLRGGGDPRLRDMTVELAVEALVLAGRKADEARSELLARLRDGSALRAWESIVTAHGGNPDAARLVRPRRRAMAVATRSGFVTAVAAETLGWIAVALGAGRRFQGDEIDFAAGVTVHARIGDRVEEGQSVATLELGIRDVDLDVEVARAAGAFAIGEEVPPVRPLICERLGVR